MRQKSDRTKLFEDAFQRIRFPETPMARSAVNPLALTKGGTTGGRKHAALKNYSVYYSKSHNQIISNHFVWEITMDDKISLKL